MDLSDQAWTKEIPDAWRLDTDYEGATYAYPGAAQSLAAIYNQDALDDLGLEIPETLDDVYQLCEDATDAGLYAYAQGLADPAGPQMLSFGQTASLVYGPDPDFKASWMTAPRRTRTRSGSTSSRSTRRCTTWGASARVPSDVTARKVVTPSPPARHSASSMSARCWPL